MDSFVVVFGILLMLFILAYPNCRIFVYKDFSRLLADNVFLNEG